MCTLRRVGTQFKYFTIFTYFNVSWVHAKCEGIDGEQYQVLSYLPDSVEYVCK